jgi:hypothetical protein
MLAVLLLFLQDESLQDPPGALQLTHIVLNGPPGLPPAMIEAISHQNKLVAMIPLTL